MPKLTLVQDRKTVQIYDLDQQVMRDRKTVHVYDIDRPVIRVGRVAVMDMDEVR